jgi:hypothetical protein
MDAVVAAIVSAVLDGLVVYILENRQLRHERLFERRAEVIAKLSELLLLMQSHLIDWSSPFQSSASNRDEQACRAAAAWEELPV